MPQKEVGTRRSITSFHIWPLFGHFFCRFFRRFLARLGSRQTQLSQTQFGKIRTRETIYNMPVVPFAAAIFSLFWKGKVLHVLRFCGLKAVLGPKRPTILA